MKIEKMALILVVLAVLAVVCVSGCTSSGDKNSLNVTNLKVSSEGYGMYYVTCDIVPKQDTSYLEMVLVWYDSSNAVIDRTPLAWNINDAKAGQTIKARGTASLYQKGTPAKVKVLIFDSAFSGGSEDGNIYNQTVTL
ncbi:hypothetical protein [Methanobacterium formicicum]|uniref:Secreted protein n=1 Tax=Methanobacterium formicicum TaxID=2162 RepID=A0A089ZHR7_METFO|nr:hypothetical protein [Methanobacterium formicicum]AIS31963.1 hypothetical protein BRM9_1147 [Methanobacterium formicicum]